MNHGFAVPHGLDGILATYGDPYRVLGDDGVLSLPERMEWESRLTVVPLPKPIPLSWAPKTLATRIRCHRLAAPAFSAVFACIKAEKDLLDGLRTYGGCYEFRTKRRNGDDLSVHSWGVAIDFNPGTNQQGSKGDMHPGLVQVFEAHGFLWGGRWRGAAQDAMHFQLATGY